MADSKSWWQSFVDRLDTWTDHAVTYVNARMDRLHSMFRRERKQSS